MKIRLNKKENLDLLYRVEGRVSPSEPEDQERLLQALRENLTFQGIAEKYRRHARELLETDPGPERADDLRSLLFRLDDADRARERGDMDGALMNAFLAGKMVVAVDTLPLAKIGFHSQKARCSLLGKDKVNPVFVKLVRNLRDENPSEGWSKILERLKDNEFGWPIDGFEIAYNEGSDTFECRETSGEQRLVSKRKPGALKNYFYK